MGCFEIDFGYKMNWTMSVLYPEWAQKALWGRSLIFPFVYARTCLILGTINK